jgi:molybdopterin converting factor small subunit
MADQLISIKVLFFAQAREQTKLSEGRVSFEVKRQFTASHLLNEIIQNYPGLKPLQNCVILSKNCTYLDLDSQEFIQLSSNDEIAVIPPISSG